jgi:sugar phosphate isomerase/epimerase
MKFGVFTVSMPNWYPIEALEKLKEIGYDGVEWRITADDGDKNNPTFWSGNRTSMTAEELIVKSAELKKKAESLNIEMPSIASYISSDEDLKNIEKHFEAASSIGTKNIRICGNNYKPEKNYREQLAVSRKEYAQIAEIAKDYSVRALIEVHMKQVAPSMAKAMQVLDGLNPEYVGIMWDPGNQIMEGMEPYEMALDIAGEYLAEIHVKNLAWKIKSESSEFTKWECVSVPLRKGMVDWPNLISILKKRDYDGWIFFEDFSSEVPIEERLKDNLSWFKKLS